MQNDKIAFHTETGRLWLDWIATLSNRSGRPLEKLKTCADLKRWIYEVGGYSVSGNLSSKDLSEAKKLRAAMISLMDQVYNGATPAASDIRTINEFAATMPPRMELAPTGDALLPLKKVDLRTVLGVIARDAIDLLSSDDVPRVKQCASCDCTAYFFDTSRPGSRRWCSMRWCGNRAKKKSFKERHAQSN